LDDKIIFALYLIIVLYTIVLFGFVVFLIPIVHRAKQMALEAGLANLKTAYDRQLLQSQVEIQEQTLKTVSRELHDNIGQKIYLAKLCLSTLEVEAPDSHGNLQLLGACLTEAAEGLHILLDNLNVDLINKGDLENAIDGLVSQLERTGIYAIDFQKQGGYVGLPRQKEIFIFRILQEAINNIIRHADARRIEIRLMGTSHRVCLSIRDDGKGFDMERVQPSSLLPGRGLCNMIDRAALIHAKLVITSEPGVGTTVRITASVNN
jgi:signal transduction histidine kinase